MKKLVKAVVLYVVIGNLVLAFGALLVMAAGG